MTRPLPGQVPPGADGMVWLTETMSMRTLGDLGTLSMDYLEIHPFAVRTPVVHDDGEEILYLIDGELEFTLGTTTFTLTAGQAVAVPRGTPHGSVNRSGQLVRMLAANSPAFRADQERTASPPNQPPQGGPAEPGGTR
ncbi:cupin domain-containing protein [Streptomyces sp. SS7]|uniref:cupin domain-containing protein n=1 Tax=Streptomyces sp. SS7 TaxID=3108485 RepID=UPI0030EF2CC7